MIARHVVCWLAGLTFVIVLYGWAFPTFIRAVTPPERKAEIKRMMRNDGEASILAAGACSPSPCQE